MTEPTVKPHRSPLPAATPILSFSPITFDVPGRAARMEVRVVAPAVGSMLPIILFSHGHGGSNFLSSMRGYGPMADFYAAHGFVVILPTHQNSKTLALDPNGPGGPLFWRSRAQDMHFLLDHLDEVEAVVPGLAGRLDRTRIAAVGHSMGGHTVAMLAGMRVTDPETKEVADLSAPRIKASVMLSPPGSGADLAPWAREHYPVLANNDFSHMAMPGLVVTGDKDFSDLFSERRDWRTDAYVLSPGRKSLVVLRGAEHLLGGVSGYDAKETSDESPERVAAIQRITWAYLQTALCPEKDAWNRIADELSKDRSSFPRVETK
jgi:predicted dienelactone hydrolase